MFMAGIDHSIANLDQRSCFALSTDAQRELYAHLLQWPGIRGAVIISTCNRTELYVSVEPGSVVDPFQLLCQLLDVDIEAYRDHYRLRQGDLVFRHLCHLACGTKSRIWGEDQIIAQVKDALALSRDCSATDQHLEVLFRTAITAAKKVRSTIRFSNAECSVAKKALAVIRRHRVEYPGDQRLTDVLVIGSGLIGRMVAAELVDHGYRVAVTRRMHGGKSHCFPAGVQLIDYHDRYAHLENYSVVVSATSSPHHTLVLEFFRQVIQKPMLLIDLAVPRDIDPRIAGLPGMIVEDIDSIASDEIQDDHACQLQAIDAVIEKYSQDLQRWRDYRMRLQA